MEQKRPIDENTLYKRVYFINKESGVVFLEIKYLYKNRDAYIDWFNRNLRKQHYKDNPNELFYVIVETYDLLNPSKKKKVVY